MRISSVVSAFLLMLALTPALGQLCGDNVILNPGFEEVEPPCGAVPPGGLINGAFNSGCMPGWEAAWGTPSVDAGGPYAGQYYASFGANNEGIFQNLEDLCTQGLYRFSFYHRRLKGTTGSMDVYFASGLTNQPTSNTGNPPLPIQGGWNLIVSQNVNSNNWQQYVNNNLQITNPGNNQLLFVLSGSIDIGLDEVELELRVADPVFTCASAQPGSYTFSGSLENVPPNYNVTSWSWDFGDGSTASGQNASHTFSSQGTYEVCLTITDACNCEITTCQTIIYDDCSCGCDRDEDPPSFPQTPEPLIEVSCLQEVPAPQVLTAQDACDNDPTVTFSETESGPACNRTILRTWVATDRCGRTAQVSQTIRVQDLTPPEFVVPPGDAEVECPNHVAAFEAWIQNKGGALVDEACGGNLTWNVTYDSIPQYPCGFTTARFRVTDACGNSDERTATFFSSDPDLPEIVSIPEDLTVFCLPSIQDTLAQWIADRAGFAAQDLCGPVTYTNNFNGDTSGQVIPVTFTATDLCGNALSLTARFVRAGGSDTLFVNAFTCDPAQAGQDTMLVTEGGCEFLSITNTTFLPPDLVVLSQSSCDPLLAGSDTLVLKNQAGCDSVVVSVTNLLPSDTLRLKSATCDPAQAGSDTLRLQNAFGCDSLVITEVDLLPSSLQAITLFTCDPAAVGTDTLKLTNQSGCDSLVIRTIQFTGQYQETKPVTLCGPGVPYSDTLLVTTGPCDSLFITAYSYLDPDTTFLQASTCDPTQAGQSVTVYSNGVGCDSTVFTLTALLPSDNTLIETTTCDAGSAGTQQFLLQNRFGCDSLVTVNTLYVGLDTQFVQKTTCDPAQAGTQTEVVPGTFCDTVRVISYSLLPSSTGRDTVFSCANTGPISDTLLLTNFLGCDSLHITEFRYAPLEAQAEIDDESCAGARDGRIEVLLLTGGTAPFSYRLEGGSAQSLPLFSGLAPGTYRVIVRDAAGCADTLTALNVGVGEVLTVDAGPDREASPGEIIQLSATGSTALAQVQWTATDPLACAGCAQTALGPLSVAQTVTLNGVSAAGCTATDQLELFLRRGVRVYIPNGFSPDNDGINDIFSVFGNELVRRVRNLAIYDRWGNALYYREDLPVNDPGEGWDGRFRGKPMDPGVFVYVVEVEFTDGSVELYKGDVTLVR